MSGVELNIDGLVGPTHNYAGLSPGNIASQNNRGRISNPRAAALQGLEKMRLLIALGLPQAVLPPQERPDIAMLRDLGFSGDNATVWRTAMRDAPAFARAAAAATSMWTANAATVSASADTADGRVHLSVANLATMLHRQREAVTTAAALRAMFANSAHFQVHDALPCHAWLSDEGAANHMRLAAAPDRPGVNVFVYGRTADERWSAEFPARQTLEACQAIARRHGLDPARTHFVRQSRRAIAAGAFHNDVVAVTGADVLFAHETAFQDMGAIALFASPDKQVIVSEAQAPLGDVIASYLFNSQLIAPPGANGLLLIAPQEAHDTPAIRAVLEQLIDSGGPITAVRFLDLRESMRNGGGPACLRLRAPLRHDELAAITEGFVLTPERITQLEAFVQRHYRDQLSPDDLADPHLIEETRTALDALTQILPLGPGFYPFQRA